MKFVNKRAFTFVEALVGLSLFSFILMLYLPAFYLELSRMSLLQKETQQWQIFHELVVLHSNSNVTPEQFENTKLTRLNQSPYAVTYFDCQLSRCQIQFSDGEEYDVILEEINTPFTP